MNEHKTCMETENKLWQRIEELEYKIEKLHMAAEGMRTDLLIRGETDQDGTKVVNVSSSIWNVFCDALDDVASIKLER